jgi:hypothetical protein
MEHRRCGRTLARRVNTKLGTLSLSEGILLPRVHDELGGSQQTLQRKLGRICRILLEGLLQIALEQSVEAIILAREDLFEFAEEQRLRIGWHVAIVGKAEMSCSENCLRVSAMLAWSTVMVFRIDLYKLYHLS